MWTTLYNQILASSWLEIVAALAGVASVWFARKESILAFPIGILSTGIYTYLLFIGGLYAVSGINLYYTLVSVYGWFMWSRVDSNNQKLKITYNSKKTNLIYLFVTMLVFAGIFLLLKTLSGSNYSSVAPYVLYLDALTSSIFAIAMVLEARKKVENWIYWIVADVISIPFYFSQGYVFTAFQYVVFTAIAIAAYITWRGKSKQGA